MSELESLILFLVLSFYVAAAWKIFVKAGYPGWLVLFPFLNLYVLIKIVGKPGYVFFLCFFPLINIIFIIWIINLLSKSFGKDEGFTFGLIFLWFIFIPILGFGKDQYLGPFGDPPAFAAYGGKDSLILKKKRSHNSPLQRILGFC